MLFRRATPEHSQFVRPSAPRLAEKTAREAAKPQPLWRVEINFSADGETDQFTHETRAPSAEAAEDRAYNALIKEYGGDLTSISFRTKRARTQR